MAIPNQVIIDSPVNTVNIKTNNNSLKIISPVCNTEVTVTQPVTNIIQVATPGAMGPQGPAGPSGSIGSLNTASLATTGSNIFIGNQTITGSINLTSGSFYQNGVNLVDISLAYAIALG